MIRRAIPFAVATLLLAGPSVQSHPHTLPDAHAAGWEGEKVCELQHQTETHRVLRCRFPPGVGHERHFHPAHYGYALSGGRMQLTSGSGVRVAEIETGSHYTSDGVEWHEVVNVGETTVTYLIVEELQAK